MLRKPIKGSIIYNGIPLDWIGVIDSGDVNGFNVDEISVKGVNITDLIEPNEIMSNIKSTIKSSIKNN